MVELSQALFGHTRTKVAHLGYGDLDNVRFASAFAGYETEFLALSGGRSAQFCEARLREFCAGRLCATRCLEALGRPRPIAMLGRNTDLRSPRWPRGVTGSISHSTKRAVAAASIHSSVAAIGIDIIDPWRVSKKLGLRITNADEQRVLDGLALDDGLCAYALTFAAKEAFYKAHFQIDPRFLAFSALRISNIFSDSEPVLAQDWNPGTVSGVDRYGFSRFGPLRSGSFDLRVGDDQSLTQRIARTSIRWVYVQGSDEIICAAVISV